MNSSFLALESAPSRGARSPQHTPSPPVRQIDASEPRGPFGLSSGSSKDASRPFHVREVYFRNMGIFRKRYLLARTEKTDGEHEFRLRPVAVRMGDGFPNTFSSPSASENISEKGAVRIRQWRAARRMRRFSASRRSSTASRVLDLRALPRRIRGRCRCRERPKSMRHEGRASAQRSKTRRR